MLQQFTDPRTKAVVLVLLVLSGGLMTPLSGAGDYKFISGNDSAKLGDQVLKAFNSQPPSGSENGAHMVVLGSDGEVSSLAVSSYYADGMGSQFFNAISSIEPPNARILILQDAQDGHSLVLIIGSGQNVENNRLSPLPFLFAPLLQVWLDSERRRSRFRIYVEILDLLKQGPMTPYEVAFHLRLNRKKAGEYLEYLTMNSFLESTERDGRASYSITHGGKTFVENLKSILERRDTDDL